MWGKRNCLSFETTAGDNPAFYRPTIVLQLLQGWQIQIDKYEDRKEFQDTQQLRDYNLATEEDLLRVVGQFLREIVKR